MRIEGYFSLYIVITIFFISILTKRGKKGALQF
nr:MAG TPA: hypothetical protein [Caudoviricetes sp.]